MDVEPRQPATLPLDLLLEIIARSDDVTTVVRCAVGSKALLAAMLDPGFHRRRAEANGGFDPGLLMAVSYRLTACHIDSDLGTVTGTDSIVVQPPGRLHRFDTDLLAGSSEPPSSRDGLLVFLRHGILLVCNTITGHVTPLPSMGQRGTSTAGMYKPALLSVHGAGRSFELLVMYHKHDRWGRSAACSLRTQIFTSREGEWGAARDIHIHNLSPGVRRLYEASFTAPAVVRCSVHWLCYTRANHHSVFDDPELIILALHAESAQATVIELPQELLARMGSHGRGSNPAERFILATTAATAQGERRLSLVVAEALVISMWTPVPQVDEGSSISWSRQVVIRRREIGRPLACVLDAYQPIRFSTFGERSGTVLFWMKKIGLVQLNLGTKKALVLYRDSNHQSTDNSQALLHEINLISVLRCMKSF